jgi:hypothetical protein
MIKYAIRATCVYIFLHSFGFALRRVALLVACVCDCTRFCFRLAGLLFRLSPFNIYVCTIYYCTRFCSRLAGLVFRLSLCDIYYYYTQAVQAGEPGLSPTAFVSGRSGSLALPCAGATCFCAQEHVASFLASLAMTSMYLCMHASAIAPRTSRILSMPRGSFCDEACKRLFFNFFNSLSGLHSQKR